MSAKQLRKILGRMCDGDIQIEFLQSDDVEEAVKVMDAFFAKECVCLALEINLPEAEKARDEFRTLCREVAADGISLIARYVPTDEIVSAAFNKFHTQPQQVDEACVAENFKDNYCHTPNMQEAMNYLIKMEDGIDIFNKFSTDSFIEIMFLATKAGFEGKRIARNLCAYTLKLAGELGVGFGTERIPELLREKRPKVVTAVFTSRFSQKIGENLEFELLKRIPYSEFSYNGRPFSEAIGPMHPTSDFVAKKLF